MNQPTDRGLSAKKELIKKTSSYLGNRPYYLQTDSYYGYFGGWRYLFKAYGSTPAQSSADQLFDWIYQKEIAPYRPKLTVTVYSLGAKLPARRLKILAAGNYLAVVTE